MTAAAAVVLVIALLSVQVANLSRQVNPAGSSTNAIATAVKSVLAQQHRTVILTIYRYETSKPLLVATDADGDAYLINSSNHKTFLHRRPTNCGHWYGAQQSFHLASLAQTPPLPPPFGLNQTWAG